MSTIVYGATVYPCHGPIECESQRAHRPARPPSKAVAAARERDNLRAALDHRDVIEQAKGILMERNILTPDQAFTRAGPRSVLCKMSMLSCGVASSAAVIRMSS